MRRINMFLAFAFFAFAAFGVAQAPANEKIAVMTKCVITGTGETQKDGVLLIDGGRIVSITTPDQIPQGYAKVDRTNAVAAPGFIDVMSVASAPFDLDETKTAVDAEARVADALNLKHRDFGLLAAAGVTSAVILPGASNVVSGSGAVVKTAGGRDRLVAADQPMRLNLGREAGSGDRFPTAFMSAKSLLRETLEDAKRPERAETALGQAVRKQRPTAFWANEAREMRAALEFKKDLDIEFSLFGAAALRETLPLFEKTGMKVAIAAIDFTSSKRALTLPKMIEDAGLKLAFYAETPRRAPESLRLAAALAAKNGVSVKAALASVTSVPAEIAGVEARVGTLAAGKDADFVLFSGDPLDLSSTHAETWIQGERVWKKAHGTESGR